MNPSNYPKFKGIVSLMALLFVALVTRCGAVKVSSSYDPSVEFSTGQSFGWVQAKNNQFIGPSYAFDSTRFKNIKNSIKSALEDKGLTFQEISPDLLVGFHVFVEEKQTITNQRKDILDPYSQPINYWEGYETYLDQEYYNFLEGILMIDIIDGKNSNVIWQGVAHRYLETIPQVSIKEMNRGIEKVLRKFPPK